MPGTKLAQREDVLASFEMMRESLREILKETSILRRGAIEEEVLMEAENIDESCSNTLRYAGQLRNLVSSTGRVRGKRS